MNTHTHSDTGVYKYLTALRGRAPVSIITVTISRYYGWLFSRTAYVRICPNKHTHVQTKHTPRNVTFESQNSRRCGFIILLLYSCYYYSCDLWIKKHSVVELECRLYPTASAWSLGEQIPNSMESTNKHYAAVQVAIWEKKQQWCCSVMCDSLFSCFCNRKMATCTERYELNNCMLTQTGLFSKQTNKQNYNLCNSRK